jgi:hypothetical protein
MCIDLQAGSVTSWDGQAYALPMARKPNATSGNCSLIGPLSPAGVVATNIVSSSQGGCGGSPNIYLVAHPGGISSKPVISNARPQGWIDATHLVVDVDFSITNSSIGGMSILNVTTRALARIEASGYFVAVLPGGL